MPIRRLPLLPPIRGSCILHHRVQPIPGSETQASVAAPLRVHRPRHIRRPHHTHRRHHTRRPRHTRRPHHTRRRRHTRRPRHTRRSHHTRRCHHPSASRLECGGNSRSTSSVLWTRCQLRGSYAISPQLAHWRRFRHGSSVQCRPRALSRCCTSKTGACSS